MNLRSMYGLVLILGTSALTNAAEITILSGQSIFLGDDKVSCQVPAASSRCQIAQFHKFFDGGCEDPKYPYAIVNQQNRLVVGCFSSVESAGAQLKLLMNQGTCI